MPRFSWLVPPLLGCLVVCVYAWVVCSAREGGSRPLLLVYLPVMSVLRFRERASVAVAGFGKVGGRVVEPVVALVAFGVCVVPGFALKLCACVDVCQEGFDAVRVLPCDLVVLSGGFVPVLGDEAGAGAAHTDGDGHCVDVADVCGEVSLLFVGQ